MQLHAESKDAVKQLTDGLRTERQAARNVSMSLSDATVNAYMRRISAYNEGLASLEESREMFDRAEARQVARDHFNPGPIDELIKVTKYHILKFLQSPTVFNTEVLLDYVIECCIMLADMKRTNFLGYSDGVQQFKELRTVAKHGIIVLYIKAFKDANMEYLTQEFYVAKGASMLCRYIQKIYSIDGNLDRSPVSPPHSVASWESPDSPRNAFLRWLRNSVRYMLSARRDIDMSPLTLDPFEPASPSPRTPTNRHRYRGPVPIVLNNEPTQGRPQPGHVFGRGSSRRGGSRRKKRTKKAKKTKKSKTRRR